MTELTSEVLVPLSTPDEVERRLGVLKVTDGAPSTNRLGAMCDRLDLMHDLDGRPGIRSTTMTGLTGTGSVGDGRRVGPQSSSDPGPVRTLDTPVFAAPSGEGVAGVSAPANDAVTNARRAARTAATGHATRANGEVGPRSFTIDAAESRGPGRPQRTRRVTQIGPGSLDPARQDDPPSGQRWGAPPVVAATKLMIPRSRRPLVPRPRVSARLDEDYRLALVSAPAGYGKTAALATWAAEHRDRVAWLSCDPCDAEPTRLMSGLLAAIAAQWPGVADDAFVLLDRNPANIYDAAVAAANELATIAVPGVIVMDDLHLASPDPALLTAFTDALPDGFRLVVGTRSDPPLSLARLRLRGDLLELRGTDLGFTPVEVSEFFALYDICLTGDELRRVHELTEGWPAGAQLAALAFQRGVEHEEFLQAFAGTDRAVSDFLVSEMLAGLPPELVEFLVETSVLEAFDADLCAAVTGSDDAEVMLDRLLAANLFVVPLDEQGRWYRYHHQFGAFLRARLASSGTANLRAAHDRACRVLEDRGDEMGALQQAMAMPDGDRAGRIVRAALNRSASQPDGTDLTVRAIRMWLHEYGVAVIETDPAWVVELLIGLTSLSDTDDVPAWLERVRQAHPRADGELTALIEMAHAAHHQQRGQPLRAIARLRAAAEATGGIRSPRGPLGHLDATMATAQIQAGQAAEALAGIERALAHPVGSPVADDVHGPGIAALAAAVNGELTRAEQLARLVAHAADEVGVGRHEPGRTFADLALVEVHLERHDHETAARILQRITQAGEASHRPLLRSLITLHQAKLARVLGDEIAAEALLGQARCCYTEPDAAVRQTFGEEAVAQALRFDPSDAARLLSELDQGSVATHVLRVRLALADHDDRAAAAMLADLPPATSRRTRVERDVLYALSLLARDAEKANSYLCEALEAGKPERLIRAVVDQGPGVHHLLLSCTPVASQERYLEDLLAATRRILPPVKAAARSALVEPLSPREVVVLRYLCSRLTFREIAAVLYVSANTLKSHVRSIYRKLAVASRADAVNVGRSNGLL